MDSLAGVMALTAIIGIGIQELLEFLDPIVLSPLSKIITTCLEKIIEVKESTVKKSVVIFFTSVLGLFVVYKTGLSLLGLIDESLKEKMIDRVLTALVIGGDAEIVNSAQKFFSYVKDKNKDGNNSSLSSTTPSISIPSTSSSIEEFDVGGELEGPVG